MFPESISIASRRSRRLVRYLPVATAVLLVLAVATCDVLTANVNLSILYAIPILVAARNRSRSLIWRLALLMIVLTYVGYFVGPKAAQTDFSEMIWNYRMFNRTLVAVSLVAITAVVHLWISVQSNANSYSRYVSSLDPEHETVAQILRSFELFSASLVCGLFMLCVALTDAFSPGQFNLPILYAFPLMVCAAVRSRALVWSILPFLLVLTFVGYFIGPAPEYEPGLAVRSLLTNRFLAASAQVGIALLAHVRIGDARRFA